MTEIGSQAWLYGALSNASITGGNITSYPTADYQIDDSLGESLTDYQGAYLTAHYSRASEAVV